MENPSSRLYKNGEQVKFSGNYQCVSCGSFCYFNAGEMFRECDICFAGTEDGPDGYGIDSEFWRFVS